MSFDKSELMSLDANEKRQLAFELLDSIDEEFVDKQVPEWKKELIQKRLQKDIEDNMLGTSWAELRKKYKSQ